MELNIKYIISPTGLLKLGEILCVIISFGIFRGGHAYFGDANANYFACGVLVTALIITPLLLVCYIMGKTEIQKTILEMALNCLLFIFLVAAGGTAISTWQSRLGNKGKSKSMAMGSFSILAGLCYLGDFVLAVLKFRE